MKNFFGTVELSEKILPLLSDNGKIVTVGSTAGRMSFLKIKSEEIQNRFKNPNLTKEQLVALLAEFKDAISANQVEERGWPKWIYGTSKLGINIFCNILSKSQEVVSRGIQVYSCCPGYVATDMTSHKGTLTVDEGIRTPVFLVELPFEINNQFQGQFFQK